MKVLMICVPRTGSNSLIKALSKGLNIPHLSIPDSFNITHHKAFIDSILNKNEIIFRMSPIHNVSYDLLSFTSFFDEVVLLSRKNEENHYKSIVNLYYREHVAKLSTRTSYVYEDIPSSTLEEIKKVVDWEDIVNQKLEIENLGMLLNESILYYEDMYFSDKGINYLKGKFKKKLNIDTFNYVLFNTNKLRINREKYVI